MPEFKYTNRDQWERMATRTGGQSVTFDSSDEPVQERPGE
jgi:hypothetical protein